MAIKWRVWLFGGDDEKIKRWQLSIKSGKDMSKSDKKGKNNEWGNRNLSKVSIISKIEIIRT